MTPSATSCAMQHRGSDPAHPGWTRAYAYDEPSLIEPHGGAPPKTSNRLTAHNRGPGRRQSAGDRTLHDVHGNMTACRTCR